MRGAGEVRGMSRGRGHPKAEQAPCLHRSQGARALPLLLGNRNEVAGRIVGVLDDDGLGTVGVVGFDQAPGVVVLIGNGGGVSPVPQQQEGGEQDPKGPTERRQGAAAP